jgi:hypothetical protein
VLYANKSALVIRSVTSISAISRWAQALLANSTLIKTALLAKNVPKVIRKPIEVLLFKVVIISNNV